MTRGSIVPLDSVCNVEYGTRVVNKRDGGSVYPVYGGGGATFKMDTFNRENRLVVARFAMSEECTRFVSGRFYLNDSGLTVSPRGGSLIQRFLDYQLLSNNQMIYALGKGSAQRNLDIPAFRQLGIFVPSDIESQSRIVSILDAAFADIATARTNAENNLQNARALFDGYLNQVFTARDKAWERKTLKDITSVLGDGLHGTPKYSDNGDYYFINGNNLKDGRILLKEGTKRVSLDEYNKHKKELTDRTVLVSINGTLGNVAFFSNEKVILGKSACYFNLLDTVSKHFIKYLISSPHFLQYAHREATGATIKNVSLKSMRGFEVPLPPLSEQKSIVVSLNGLLKETQRLELLYQKKLAALNELKQSLLHQAFNGNL